MSSEENVTSSRAHWRKPRALKSASRGGWKSLSQEALGRAAPSQAAPSACRAVGRAGQVPRTVTRRFQMYQQRGQRRPLQGQKPLRSELSPRLSLERASRAWLPTQPPGTTPSDPEAARWYPLKYFVTSKRRAISVSILALAAGPEWAWRMRRSGWEPRTAARPAGS